TLDASVAAPTIAQPNGASKSSCAGGHAPHHAGPDGTWVTGGRLGHGGARGDDRGRLAHRRAATGPSPRCDWTEPLGRGRSARLAQGFGAGEAVVGQARCNDALDRGVIVEPALEHPVAHGVADE